MSGVKWAFECANQIMAQERVRDQRSQLEKHKGILVSPNNENHHVVFAELPERNRVHEKLRHWKIACYISSCRVWRINQGTVTKCRLNEADHLNQLGWVSLQLLILPNGLNGNAKKAQSKNSQNDKQ